MLSDLKFIARDVSEKLLRLDSKFLQWCGKSALRPEARLLMLIGTRGPISVKEAMHDSSLSHRSFYMILDKLKDAGIVEVRNDTIDARVRRIYINEEHEDKYTSIYECFDDEPEITSQFERPINGLRLLK